MRTRFPDLAVTKAKNLLQAAAPGSFRLVRPLNHRHDRQVDSPQNKTLVIVIELGNVGRRQARREIASPGPVLDDPLAGEPRQRLPDRRGAQSQLLSQARDDQGHARAEPTFARKL